MIMWKNRGLSWFVHLNPDGTDGGLVSETAEIGKNVTISKTGRVLPGAKVPDNTIVGDGVFFTPDGPVKLM